MIENSSGQTFWARCSNCKKEIAFGSLYYLCSVSTCRHVRKGFRFCSVPCWDSHLGYARHRESWAEENFAPSSNQTTFKINNLTLSERQKKMENTSTETTNNTTTDTQTETLVVVSKVKAFIKNNSGMNSSQCAVDQLSNIIAKQCLAAIENAKTSGRKTVMGRDFI